ncbi:hypothetical protein [Corallococcus macrosporus]|uniref:Uncharacterized protein n=1 Tax=Corallococcus macrosporus DSM 14697 TaxID=1189310 RepID=A0A250JY44_9BACT|nr:hypothetical protein [Corallococcus macrosporus]ATB48765.1 hypothetical protein MYMAC_004396 [Corallococcus macrosporus DSM 14697]
MPKHQRKLRIYISADALALLKHLDYPCSEEVLASAKRVEGLEDEGMDYELSGTRDDFESLAGWVAGDANHADRRQKRKLALLLALSDALEAVL